VNYETESSDKNSREYMSSRMRENEEGKKYVKQNIDEIIVDIHIRHDG